jgi:hypothetical protein
MANPEQDGEVVGGVRGHGRCKPRAVCEKTQAGTGRIEKNGERGAPTRPVAGRAVEQDEGGTRQPDAGEGLQRAAEKQLLAPSRRERDQEEVEPPGLDAVDRVAGETAQRRQRAGTGDHQDADCARDDTDRRAGCRAAQRGRARHR